MADPNRAIFQRAVELLEPLLHKLVFVGGCATGLLVTDSAAGGIRPTKDVDAIVRVASYAEYAAISDRMRALGFVEDSRPGAPTCRFRHHDLIVDLMPTAASILGFTNRWYVTAVTSAQTISIAGHRVKLVDPVHFVATKLEAFHGRDGGNFGASHDLEDIMMIVDGRPELIGEIERSESGVRTYVVTEINRLLENRDFLEGLAGFLLPDAASQARRPILEARLRTIGQTGMGAL